MLFPFASSFQPASLPPRSHSFRFVIFLRNECSKFMVYLSTGYWFTQSSQLKAHSSKLTASLDPVRSYTGLLLPSHRYAPTDWMPMLRMEAYEITFCPITWITSPSGES